MGIRRLMAGEGLLEPLASTLVDVVPYILKRHKIDGLMAVPPKPGEKSKFKEVISLISKKYEIEDLSRFIWCNKNYPSLWELSKKERFEAVGNARVWDGHKP